MNLSLKLIKNNCFFSLISKYNRPNFVNFSTKVKDETSKTKLTLTTEIDGVRNIKLNDPKTRNSLSLKMMDQILEDLTSNQNDEKLRCIVLSAEGSVFSAGHNLKELTNEQGTDFHKLVFARCSELMLAFRSCPVPVISKVNGLAAAAGLQLVTSTDIIICSDISTFSTPGASFGIFCSTPGISLVRSVNKMKAAQMLLTGLPITSQDAYSSGLVSSVVSSDNLDAEIEKNCNAIKSKSRSVIQLGKKFFYEQINMDIRSAYKFGEEVMTNNIKMDDGQEGIKSFIEKRKPVWK